jgi:hypothetical protein
VALLDAADIASTGVEVMKIYSRLLRKGIGRRSSAGCCTGAIVLALAATAADARASANRHGGASAAPVVDVAGGAVRGKSTRAVQAFQGIPYV